VEDSARAYWDRVDPLVEAINIYDGPEAFLTSIAPVPRGATLIYAADFCLYEIQNGGLLQFFANSTGVLAPEAIDGFAVIGMPNLAAIVGSAIAFLGTPYPRDIEVRAKALLTAAGNKHETVASIMANKKGRYRALRDATKSLGLDGIDEEIYKIAESESGGFDNAKERYVAQLPYSK